MLLLSFIIFAIFTTLMIASLAQDRISIAIVDFIGVILSMVEIIILIA